MHQTGYYFMIYTIKPARDSMNTILSLFRSFLTCSGFGPCKMNGSMFSKKIHSALDESMIEIPPKKNR